MSLDTRYHSATHAPYGWPDGPAQFDPATFSAAYTVCFQKLYFGSVPPYCIRTPLMSLSCKGGLANCTVLGEIDKVSTVAGLCWKHSGYASFVTQSSHGGAVTLPFAGGCVAMADSSIATYVDTTDPEVTLITFSSAVHDTYDFTSAAIAFACIFLLILWIGQPVRNRYYWLDADVVAGTMFVNWSRHKPPAPPGCDSMCTKAMCAWPCRIPVSTYLLAVTGLLLPFALAFTASARWPRFACYQAPTLLYNGVLILLLGSSLAHLPTHRFSNDGESFLQYTIATALCAVSGKALGGVRVSVGEHLATAALCTLTGLHATFSLIRRSLQRHPSLQPTDAGRIVATAAVLAATATVAGYYTANREKRNI